MAGLSFLSEDDIDRLVSGFKIGLIEPESVLDLFEDDRIDVGVSVVEEMFDVVVFDV